MEHPMMRSIFILNTLPWYTRLPIKWVILGLTVFIVCFPYPNLFVRHIRHWSNPNALIEPDAPALQPWVEELRPELPSDLPPRQALQRVERFVYEKVPYEWDWNTWGLSDYLPTVTEVIEMGKEDCDGRAVIAASLLQNFGFKAQIVTDFTHMWVATDKGETMSPGRTKTFIATEQGVRMELHVNALKELPRAAGFGIAVFPIRRELIVLVVLWFLLLRPGGGVGCCLAALVFLVNGLLFLQLGGAIYERPVVWRQLVGLANIAAAAVTLFGWARHHARWAALGVLRRNAIPPHPDASM